MPGAMLQPEYRERFIPLLGMLGSDFDGERATAARMVEEHRRKCGLSWHEILSPALAPEALKPERPRKARKPKPPEPTWRDKAEVVAGSILATEWEQNFANGLLTKWAGPLTPKQVQCLESLFAKCGGREEKAA